MEFFAYAGKGEENRKAFHYSQACRLPDGRIETAGQGGWDPKTGEYSDDIGEEIDQAFRNVELNLKDAGGKGWSQVFKVVSYHVPINDESLGHMVRNFRQYLPDHQPLWTCTGVPRLGGEKMRVEIEVVAYDPK